MKIIDLLNKISNQEPVPNKILVDGKYFYWDSQEMFYQTEHKLDLLEVGEDYSTWDFLNFIVMEDENKEIDIDSIEEIDLFDNGQGFENIKIVKESYDNNFTNITTIINDLLKAVKQLNKKIKEKE